ncbi:MAG: SDR family NAD(P)-dependent oxidoreductase [Acidobacteria bacterium]|nr:SDR family NAD(P)-dependent oxidoreductase [Acidobacteriota bacterium]
MSDMTVNRQQNAHTSDGANVPGRWADGIAIIGMSARFPQSQNVQEYWQHLLAGDVLISDLNDAELHAAGVSEQDMSSHSYVRRGSAIRDAEMFDAGLFNLSRREAEMIDPQQRVLLECAWEALDDAGHTGEDGRTGVFAGVGMNTYVMRLLANPAVIASAGGYQLMLANDKDFCATRVAYKLNLRGPAVNVQSACSTSLAAVHLACMSLLSGECDMALAGGASISFPQSAGYSYIPGMILSPDGVCRPFDADAKGTVPGCGAGIVVLKRLSRAVLDGDNIVAVIHGSAWNNDGNGKVGFTAPSVDGQVSVLRQALRAADISPKQVGYIEAHGTATELGDPIEVAALTTVYAEGISDAASCVLGSAKSNMGHADVAAGIAGLIKAALATRNGIVPPTPTYSKANPSLQLENGPFLVSSSAISWLKQGRRWSGVSSFGIGGTNVHVILGEAPEVKQHDTRPGLSVVPLSARTPAALASMRERLADYLESASEFSVQSIAETLQEGRRELACRRAFVVEDKVGLIAALRKPVKTGSESLLSLGRDVVYLFPGQGQQFFGMASKLYETDADFRQTIEEGALLLRDEFGIECIDLICGRETPLKERLNDTGIAQPLLFLVEYALALRWRSLGVEPSAVAGHSLGELTAATVAGVFTYHDGLRLAAERGRLMAQTPAGMMLAAALPPERLPEFLEHDVWIAAENGPKMTVASGPSAAVEALEARLQQAHIACVRLASKNAFHTPLMADAAKAFRQKVESVSRRPPTIPILSNVTGTWADPLEIQSAQYWGNQILSRVRFTQNLAALAERPRLLLEVGPGEALIGIAKQQLAKSVMVASLGTEKRRITDDVIFLEALAKAWESGATVKWKALRPGTGSGRVSLPSYPFERERFYIDSAKARNQKVEVTETAEVSEKPGKRSDIADWFYSFSWQNIPPALLSTRERRSTAGVWLALIDQQGLGARVIERLQKEETTKVISVEVAESFRQEGDRFFVDPAIPDHYRMLWRAITEAGFHPEGLIDFWTLRCVKANAYDSLLLLLQAARIERQKFHRIEIVTDDLESIAGEAISEPVRSEALGLLRVLPTEYSGVDWRSIDVHLESDSLDRSAAQIVEELQIPGNAMSVAYRGESRWLRHVVQAPLPASTARPFRDGGVYLITGGTGGIGYSLAQHLLREYSAKVLLIGRSKLPPRGEGERVDRTGTDQRRIERIKELTECGGRVVYLDADVTRVEDVTRAIAFAEEQLGAINGVIHAAGVAGSGTIATQTLDESIEIRKAKVAGSLALASSLGDRQLDFFLFCSSISAWAPAFGQGAYAAANTFENYFAMYCRKSLNLPAVAIGFDAWREVGMVADMELPEGLESAKEERLRTAMTTSEGIEVVHRVLSHWRAPHILTSTVELSLIATTSSYEDTPSQQDAVQSLAENQDYPLQSIIEIWKDLLAIEQIEPTDNFFELGGHSLMGTMLIARLRDQFGVTLTLRTLFDTPTPRALAEWLRSQQVAEDATADREEFSF